MTLDLFTGSDKGADNVEFLTPSSALFSGYLLAEEVWINRELAELLHQSPFRRMVTPQGQMSVLTTSWGPYGWTSDKSGYRYTTIDPLSKKPWPALPVRLAQLASRVALLAGYSDFMADSCLVNCYHPDAKMGLHQDKNEQDFSQPIVSFSLGLSATFLMGGLKRSDPTHTLTLQHGDVLVFGGPDRLRFHGVASVASPALEASVRTRINLTFRRVR